METQEILLEKLSLVEGKKLLENEITAIKEKIGLLKKSVIFFVGHNLNVVGVDSEFKIDCYYDLDFVGQLVGYSQYTYLKGTFPKTFEENFLRDFVLSGAEFKERFETNQTAFLVKVLEYFSFEQKNELLSFLLGLVISGNIGKIRKVLKNYENIYLVGDLALCGAYKEIIQKQFDINTVMVSGYSGHVFDKGADIINPY
ncbi:MAG: hypothetical protein LBV08_10580 [Clostridiales bacterium]|nr:hypothetical protein [Clostridiales bacterium]